MNLDGQDSSNQLECKVWYQSEKGVIWLCPCGKPAKQDVKSPKKFVKFHEIIQNLETKIKD